ncbi:ferredoxin-2, mitochondrial-like [Papio anubis]|uniref:ferredoxin-2, mitochondrial-like n=1 Tax=Papio anubis TaxID=9555 RepID=UPI0012ADEE23|nr:ferredoxin-2, mitochondrial-like [Papio anubis]
MHVMAASMTRGGVSARVLLQTARGTWWNRTGGTAGSGEGVAPGTTRKFQATGSRSAGEEETGGPEEPGDVFYPGPEPIIQFGIRTSICPQGERGVRRPLRPADPSERQSRRQCSPPGTAPRGGPGR